MRFAILASHSHFTSHRRKHPLVQRKPQVRFISLGLLNLSDCKEQWRCLVKTHFHRRRGYCETSFPGDAYDATTLGRTTLGRGSTNSSPGAKTVLALMFVNKLLLGHITSTNLLIVYHCFHAIKIQLSSCLCPDKPKLFTFWPFTETVCWYLLSTRGKAESDRNGKN